ncbi:MAG: hypothetical protein ACYCWW_09495 [Deltaproteobacteria bacterium]
MKPVDSVEASEGASAGPAAESVAQVQEEELSLGSYFGGYAIIFIGVIGLALALVGLMKLAR